MNMFCWYLMRMVDRVLVSNEWCALHVFIHTILARLLVASSYISFQWSEPWCNTYLMATKIWRMYFRVDFNPLHPHNNKLQLRQAHKAAAAWFLVATCRALSYVMLTRILSCANNKTIESIRFTTPCVWNLSTNWDTANWKAYSVVTMSVLLQSRRTNPSSGKLMIGWLCWKRFRKETNAPLALLRLQSACLGCHQPALERPADWLGWFPGSRRTALPNPFQMPDHHVIARE